MTFSQSIRTVFARTFQYSGRAARSEFWWFWLFNVVVSAVIGGVEGGLGLATWGADPSHPLFGMAEGPLSFATMLGLFLPMLAVTVRRLHDRNASGWWVLIPYCIYGVLPFLGSFMMEIEAVGNGGTPSSTLISWFAAAGVWLLATLIFTIILMFRGTQGPNRFGTDPLAPASQANVFA